MELHVFVYKYFLFDSNIDHDIHESNYKMYAYTCLHAWTTTTQRARAIVLFTNFIYSPPPLVRIHTTMYTHRACKRKEKRTYVTIPIRCKHTTTSRYTYVQASTTAAQYIMIHHAQKVTW